MFKLDPEFSHSLAETALQFSAPINPLLRLIEIKSNSLKTSVSKLEFPNPVGLAAGLDKNYRTSRSYLNLGFGFSVTGTILAKPRYGNPKPRLIRYIEDQSIVNALGFPSEGLDRIKKRFSDTNIEKERIVASISGLNIKDISECFKQLMPLVAGIELNLSSPNTKGLKEFHKIKNLEQLLKILNREKQKPLLVKLPPFPENNKKFFDMLKCVLDSGADGVVISNSHPKKDSKLALGVGGMSGKPIFHHTLKMVHQTRNVVGNKFGIIGCGGISDATDVWKLISHGANAVQIYSGIVFEGPLVANKINKGLKKLITLSGISSVKELFCSEMPLPPS